MVPRPKALSFQKMRLAVVVVVVVALAARALAARALAGSKPNIVFILLDDVGWGDFSFNGNPVQDTPNIHGLAAAGMVLTDVYSASPLCSPSRASALTGRLPIRNGFYTDTWFGRNGYAGQGVSGAIPDTEVLLQQALQASPR
jgi:N-acetylgalactosamine-6-sulfatase